MSNTETPNPTVTKIKRVNGIAGQYAYLVTVQYRYSPTSVIPNEPPMTVKFVGNEYGNPGPIVAISSAGHQRFVTDPDRFGSTLNPEWIRAYFAPRPSNV